MKLIDQKFVLTGVLYILILLSGIWLSRTGKPYNSGIFTIHKLFVLGTLIFLGITLFKGFQFSEASSLLKLCLVLSCFLLITVFVTGAVISIVEEPFLPVLWTHRVVPYISLIILSVTLVLYRNSCSF
ncbi:MAG: hypothetical protein JXA77_09070 [Bacteroidales bacterium]|nr:hypothetical protein [Bacteroidales bacterium]MBN2819592.1 hypothetical protein [Bacteroidales bacterium]